MVEFPEKIWAIEKGYPSLFRVSCSVLEHGPDEATEYVRADLYAALEAQLAERVKALEEAATALEAQTAELAVVQAERDAAREYAMQARLRENAAKNARVSAVSRASRTEAALAAKDAELEAVKEMYAREGRKAMLEAERAERAEAKLAEAKKALTALDRMSRGVDWCDPAEQARRWSAARRVLEGGKSDA